MSYDRYEYLKEEYVGKGRSTASIAKEWTTDIKKVFPNTIRRALVRHMIPLRDKSNAQKNFLSKNPHPLEGRPRTAEEKRKISDGIQKWWDGLDVTEAEQLRSEMSERAGEKWLKMTKEQRELAIKKMHIASRERTGMGSKNENKVADLLGAAGYSLMQRTNQFTPRNQFEIDIAIPGRQIAIEWDGVAHFLPIYGKKALSKTQEKDNRKNKVLIRDHWVVIRCRDHSTAHSVAFCKRAINQIIKLIEKNLKPGVYYIDAE